ncbi:MAG: hypothetical protein ABIM99_00360 [Candidatus Dojkabacteria bacterium]
MDLNKPAQQNKRSILRTLMRVVIGMLIVVFILTSIILGYVYFVRRDRTVNKVITTENINDDSISKAEAERRNLENVLQTPIGIDQLIKDTNVTISQDNSGNGFLIGKGYEVTNELKLIKQQILETYKSDIDFAPIFYFKLDSLVNNLDITALSNLILTEVNTSNYKIIYLDTSFTYIKDFNTLAANLKNSLSAKGVKLGIYLYPKWGTEVNYNDFLQVTNQYHKDMKLKDVVNSVDEVIIQLYGYSSEYSILPANIAPIEWAKFVVAYTSQEVTDKSKVYFEINTDYYVWPQREVSDSPKNNYAVLDIQAEVLSKKQFEAKNYVESSSNVLGDTFETMKTLEATSKKYISISPNQENIDKLIGLVASYGFKGYILK